jgi:ribosomal protein S18 acetylase RimI-like enzyme
MTFRSLSGEADTSREVADALPWVQAAGRPFIDWLLGGPRTARRILEQWMRRPSSEVFIGRAVVVDEARPVGGFIALTGAELARCRMQDAVAAAAAPPEGHASLVARLSVGRKLFGDVLPDHFYLSRMGVLPHARRCGYGRAIVHEYLRQGMGRGFGRFALDVSSGNDAAIQLYRSVGFVLEQRHHVPDVGMTYARMVLEVGSRSRTGLVATARADAAPAGDRVGPVAGIRESPECSTAATSSRRAGWARPRR